ncbi:MAG: hypothetical protein JNL75_05340 [Chitinophagales bacterium]|nr:hypothetical protein [Chitinophagales bacterium]
MKGKYRKIYLLSFILLAGITLAAVFVVFKKYRNESNNSMMVSNAKFQLSKIKERITQIENRLPIADSTLLQDIETIKLDEATVDSLLNFNSLSKESLEVIAEQLAKLSSRSSKMEKSVDALAQDSQSESTK